MKKELHLIDLICRHAGYDAAARAALEDALLYGRMNGAKTTRAIAEVVRCRAAVPVEKQSVFGRVLVWLRGWEKIA